MNIRPNRHRYLVSLASELDGQASRVRDLIGNKHWLSDGHHKESILIELLGRHLPSGILVSRGFIIQERFERACSSEQDILIIDTSREAPVFNQGGLAIALAANVLASISVKSTMEKKTIENAIDGLQTASKVGYLDHCISKTWYGAYFYTEGNPIKTKPERVYEYIAQHVKSRMKNCENDFFMPNMICSNDGLIFKVSQNNISEMQRSPTLNGFNCEKLSTAVFLGEILDHVSFSRSQDSSGIRLAVEQEAVTALDPPRYEIL